jgi:hypothetical protein
MRWLTAAALVVVVFVAVPQSPAVGAARDCGSAHVGAGTFGGGIDLSVVVNSGCSHPKAPVSAPAGTVIWVEPGCWDDPMSPQPSPDDPSYAAIWAGHTAAEGHLVVTKCPELAGGGVNQIFNGAIWLGPPHFVAFGTPAVDIGALAQQAFSSLHAPLPDPQTGPDTQLAVNRWSYLWITDPGVLTASASAGGVTVTATAQLDSVSWSMGEPVSLDKPHRLVTPVVCDGPGFNPGPNANVHVDQPAASGSCAYHYQWRSDSDRTGGTGSWPVSVTSSYAVQWTATIGISGTATLQQTTNTRFSVVEWRSELVVGPR